MKISDANILIVDDKQSILNSIELFLSQYFHNVYTIKSPNQILRLIEREPIDLVLLDMNFSTGISSGNEGRYWLKKIKEQDEHIAIILITAYGDVDLAVNSIKEGASDFILKPWDNKRLLATITNTLKLKFTQEKIRKAEQQIDDAYRDNSKNPVLFIGYSSQMKEIDKTIKKISRTDASVLILGENGTGKDLVAVEIHRKSNRLRENFIKVDVGSLSESLFESEMFGHVKGAFTDAKESRIGRFELANGGTLFLDEIGNLASDLQAKLLTALESKTITPVGSNKIIPVDVRIISATNKNLIEQVREGLFREDLYFRLNTISLDIPSLRQRLTDIESLAQKFLEELKVKYEKRNLNLSREAKSSLKSYSWPGNIRELKHTIEKAVIMCESNQIDVEDLHLGDKRPFTYQVNKDLSMEEWEKMILEKSLKDHNYNISDTARALKIGRQTLYRKIEKYGL
jgi:DNA-binding NtrC family response regulator